MATLSSNEQRKLAYFHSLAKVMTENVAQDTFESKYKASHNIRLSEIWGDNIAFSPTTELAYQESLTNSAIKYHNMVTLTPIQGSNGMAYYFNDNNRFSRPWISPTDVPDKTTNLPSNGFELKLFRQDNTQIGATEGAWAIDYYAGIIHFGQNNTPSDLAWGNIRASFYEYVGVFGIGDVTYNGFTECEFIDDKLIFNKNKPSEYIIDVSSLRGEFKPSISAIGNEDMNTLTTIYDGDLACNIGLVLTPLLNSTIEVFVNGVKVCVGNGNKNTDCYFSNDGGVTPKSYGDVDVGDKLYWNKSIVGYNLISTTDKISFIYLTK